MGRSCIRMCCNKERHHCQLRLHASQCCGLLVWSRGIQQQRWCMDKQSRQSKLGRHRYKRCRRQLGQLRSQVTLGDDMSSNWVVDVWEGGGSIGGVWGNILYLGYLLGYLFNFLSKFVLLLGELDGVSILWYSLLGHAFGVVWVNILDNWYGRDGSLDNWY